MTELSSMVRDQKKTAGCSFAEACCMLFYNAVINQTNVGAIKHVRWVYSSRCRDIFLASAIIFNPTSMSSMHNYCQAGGAKSHRHTDLHRRHNKRLVYPRSYGPARCSTFTPNAAVRNPTVFSLLGGESSQRNLEAALYHPSS